MERKNDPAGVGVVVRNLTRAVDNRPLWAQLNITSRCNLDCAYCTEHDNTKGDVPFEVLRERIEHCHRLETLHVDLIGGEPLLHPDLSRLLREVTSRGMTTGMTTNGFLLTEDRLLELMDLGVGRLQISVDAVRPKPGIPKSLQTLRSRIEMVARHPVWLWVNTVLCEETLDDVQDIAALCFETGASISFSLVHHRGHLTPFRQPERLRETLDWLRDRQREGKRIATSPFLMEYYRRFLDGEPMAWTCKGGNKAFYVSPEGRFHACCHRPSNLDFLGVTPRLLARNRGAKGCEQACGVDCMLQTSLPFCSTAWVASVLAHEKLASLGARGRALLH